VRWRIVAASADQLLSMRDVLDVTRRLPYSEKAIQQLEVLRDKFQDFPMNWSRFAPEGFPSLTRQLLAWFKENREWEEKNLPADRAPADDPKILIRTELGDLWVGPYVEQAPALTAHFLENARAGVYDGTAFFARVDRGRTNEPEERTVRAGDPRTRDVKPYDVKSLEPLAEDEPAESLLPDESRNLVPHTTGILSAWHDPADTYDHPVQFIVAADRSPALDYEYTPIGRIVDPASLETLNRIYRSKTWRDDPTVGESATTVHEVRDFFQVPVRIVKVLVFRAGELDDAGVAPLPTKAAADESERKVSTLKADAYKKEPPPAPPAPPAPAPVPPAPAPAVPGGGDGAGNGEKPPEPATPPGAPAPR
jgi:cyclophilin family peptidyl-prolyl cis-trans isomerase